MIDNSNETNIVEIKYNLEDLYAKSEKFRFIVDYTLTVQKRHKMLEKCIPFWTVRDNEVIKIDECSQGLYWLEDLDEGLATFHFLPSLDSSKTFLPMYETKTKAHIGWQKYMLFYYNRDYKTLKDQIAKHDKFFNENPECFI